MNDKVLREIIRHMPHSSHDLACKLSHSPIAEDAMPGKIGVCPCYRCRLEAALSSQPEQAPRASWRLVNVLEREISDLNADLRSWQFEFRLWRGAWLRHLGGYIVRKSHEIDGFGLRHEQQLKEEYERGAADGKNALVYRDRYIEDCARALATPAPAEEAGPLFDARRFTQAALKEVCGLPEETAIEYVNASDIDVALVERAYAAGQAAKGERVRREIWLEQIEALEQGLVEKFDVATLRALAAKGASHERQGT